MQGYTVLLAQLPELVMAYAWPFIRITGVMLVAPVFGAAVVPVRMRLIIALGLTILLVPALPAPPAMGFMTAQAILTALQQLVIGLSIGFVLQMVFDAVVVGGQTIAMSMGLGFATLVDPQRGGSVPVLSQFYLIFAILLFLAIDGHLLVMSFLASSFEMLPVGLGGITGAGFGEIAGQGAVMFAGALRIAFSAIVALLVVNLSFGVMSRAAPTLNLFAVGFPVTMSLGFIIILLSISNLQEIIPEMVDAAFGFLANVLTSS